MEHNENTECFSWRIRYMLSIAEIDTGSFSVIQILDVNSAHWARHMLNV